MRPGRNPRAAAAAAVAAVITNHHSLSAALPQASTLLEPSDRALAQEVSYGVLRHYYELDGLLKPLLKKPFKRKDSDLHSLLLAGLYQLLYMRLPDHAVVAETVEAVAALQKEWARGVINAVLRRFQREREQRTNTPKQTLAEKVNHPEWIVQRIRNAWPEQWQQILNANLERPPMTLRVNLQQQSRDEYLKQLLEYDIEATSSSHTATTIYLNRAVAVSQLPSFEKGAASVQDEAAQQCASLLDPQPGDSILDACAAPGGKTVHLLEQQPDIARLTALDHDEQRLQRVEENLQRNGMEATLLCGDAAERTWWDGHQYDRILIDAPCSATGVIRRHPDIKLLRRKGDVSQLSSTQSAILDNCWGLLKTGGTLLYATCSLFPEENEQQLQNFISRHDDASTIPITRPFGIDTGLGIQILPGDSNMDGFYYAKLIKR